MICLSQLFTAAISRPLQLSLSHRESLRKQLRSRPKRRARVRDTSFALLSLLAHITSETPLKFHLWSRTLTLRNLKRSKFLQPSMKLGGSQEPDPAPKSRSCASQTSALKLVWQKQIQLSSQHRREKKNRCCHQWPWKLSKSRSSMT